MRWLLNVLIMTMLLHLGVASAAFCGVESSQSTLAGLSMDPCESMGSGFADPDSEAVTGCSSACLGCHAQGGTALLPVRWSFAGTGATQVVTSFAEFLAAPWSETPYRPQWSI